MKKYMLSAVLSCLMFGFGHAVNAAPTHETTEALTGVIYEAPLINDPIECDTNSYCFQKDQCGDTNCQNSIVACHQLSETMFNTMVNNYSTAAPYLLGTFSAAYMRTLISSLSCLSNDHVSFTDTSGVIIFTRTFGSPFSSGTGRYSVAFLQGVLRQYNPAANDLFQFYRVKDAFGNQSVGMKLVKNNVSVFYSDMTDVYP